MANTAKPELRDTGFTTAVMQSCLASIPEETERVYLAYSGGLDSSVLLHLLVSHPARYRVIPWHVNHGLLDAAARMEQFCIDQARRYDLELRLDRLDLDGVDSNVEAEARQRRYRLFEDAIGPRDCLLTAHHADDQAETFMLNALRGSGSAGLRGIAARRRLGENLLLRPLLAFSRRQLEDYANRNELPWFNDPSNRDNRFDRNYLRNEVMPLIALRWPHYQNALAATSQLQGEIQQVLDEVARGDYQALAGSTDEGYPTLDLEGLRRLSDGRARNLLRHWIAASGLPAMPAARLREVIKQLDAKPGALPRIAMPDYSIRLYDQRLFLVRDAGLRSCQGVFEFDRQGRIEISECGLKLRREDLFERLRIADENQRVTLRFRGKGQLSKDSHRLKRLFQKHSVPPWERQSTPQVYLDGELAGILT